MQTRARAAADAAARASYGRLLAWLAARSHDVAAAEDALAEAFRAALETWPARGVPDRPEAWLLTAARRSLGHCARHARVRAAAGPAMLMLQGEISAPPHDPFPDERLALMFVCAHPAIAPAARAPLMLQVILGLDAARIASAFLTAPATLGQRLVRAKAKIRDAGLRFSVPEPAEMAPRLGAVLDAVYAAYGSGWDDVSGADPRRRDLADEALELARLVAALLPREPEAGGLLALILHCEARRSARRDEGGAFVPLLEQDTERWSRPLIEEAERTLAEAARLGQAPGRFQLEAAIQSAHSQRAVTGHTPLAGIALLYEGLVVVAPTVGALVGRAAAVAEASGPEAGMLLLEALPLDDKSGYQPYWALRAHLLSRLGDEADAREAYAQASGLTEDPAVRAFLGARLRALCAAVVLLLAAAPARAAEIELRGDDLQHVADCSGRDVLIEGSRGSFRLLGGCRSVTIRGDLAIVQAELQPGSRVLIEGGGNLVAYALTRQGAVPTVTIRGEASRAQRVTRLGP